MPTTVPRSQNSHQQKQQQNKVVGSPGHKRRVKSNRGNIRTGPDDEKYLDILQTPYFHCANKTAISKFPQVFASGSKKEREKKVKRYGYLKNLVKEGKLYLLGT